MARKPRINQIGFYHVINRGVEKRDIYLDYEDRQRFLEIIDESAELFEEPDHYGRGSLNPGLFIMKNI